MRDGEAREPGWPRDIRQDTQTALETTLKRRQISPTKTWHLVWLEESVGDCPAAMVSNGQIARPGTVSWVWPQLGRLPLP